VTGIDLIRAQIRVASGEPLSFSQKEVIQRGHAIECRINAEDPTKDFRPGPGKITSFHVPGGFGVRVDTAVYAGYVIPPFYDSMIAKLIVHAETREQAIVKMRHALDEFVIEGVPTTIDFQMRILSEDGFTSGKFDTSFVERLLEADKKSATAAVATPTVE